MSLPVLAPLVLLGCCYAAQQGFALVALYAQSWYQDSQDRVSVTYHGLCSCAVTVPQVAVRLAQLVVQHDKSQPC